MRFRVIAAKTPMRAKGRFYLISLPAQATGVSGPSPVPSSEPHQEPAGGPEASSGKEILATSPIPSHRSLNCPRD